MDFCFFDNDVLDEFKVPVVAFNENFSDSRMNELSKLMLIKDDVNISELLVEIHPKNIKSAINLSENIEGLLLFNDDKNSLYMLREKDSEKVKYEEMNLDIEAIFKHTFDVIYIADGEGVTLRVSEAAKKIWGYSPEELEGQSVYKMEKEGVFQPSVTRLVLKAGRKVSAIQITKTGKRLIILGIPIKDENDNVIRVVNVSRNITEVSHLQKELQDTKSLLEGYREELLSLREKKGVQNRLVYRSSAMRKVIAMAKKAAPSNSPVIVKGENGVGKRLLCEFIHNYSERSSNPFIVVNCAAITDNIFLEDINVTGSDGENSEHIGSKAHNGTIIFENISELSKKLQGDLKGFVEHIQNNSNSARIMATTDVDLYKLMEKGKFRKDLFFLLNAIPIEISPLKDRREDIIPLCQYFVRQFNDKQSSNKYFSNELRKFIERYDWPGNVNELKNVIENMILLSDGEMLSPELLPEYIRGYHELSPSISVNELIPIKEAIELVEMQLLNKAKERYMSTTKMAEVLGINQSNISRKLQKYNI
ncbi:sigma 54-interacting transcriptional regulator [Lentibacillus cibarius]|uniref:PAS domain S-box protein n=1 Tax=Lentibacillus cibarius TaxID=2583219 RepID=A0A5S3QIW9_9BACI|nr:sigma 54-interacting transcriptional regulator [Lentibacillus cibarius]TMN21805.1 PAS domain S-box protein [Lentibacillus cibarius]